METKVPGKKLTVIIRDDSPMFHCGDNSSYRRVTIDFTEDQLEQLKLRATTKSMGKSVFEVVSKCFIELIEEK